MDEDVTIGPLINEDGVKKVVNQLKDAESKGAKLSRSLDEAQEMGGNFLKPSSFQMRIKICLQCKKKHLDLSYRLQHTQI